MSKNQVSNIELWNAIISLNADKKAKAMSIVMALSNDTDNTVVEVKPEPTTYALVMTRKVAPTVFSAIHHACKDGGATWNKSAKAWEFETKQARDKVLRAQKKYAKDNGFECVLANA